jgi:hypothetical protein
VRLVRAGFAGGKTSEASFYFDIDLLIAICCLFLLALFRSLFSFQRTILDVIVKLSIKASLSIASKATFIL